MNVKFQRYNLTKLIFLISKELKSHLTDLLNEKKFFLKLFNFKKPVKVFLNNSRGINEFLSETSELLKIPCFIVPHGTLARGKNKCSKIYNDIIAEEVTSKKAINCVQSKIALNYFKNNFNKKNYKITGNLIFASAKRKRKKYFLYAVTTRDFVNMHFYGVETFYEFFKNLKDLDEISKELNVNICVKLHPLVQDQMNNLQDHFKKLTFSNKKIDILLKSSIATISFSSTVIEDSLGSSVPVVLFDKSKRYNHCEKFYKSLNKQSSVVYYASNLFNLRKAIKSCLNGKKVDFLKFIYKKSMLPNFL